MSEKFENQNANIGFIAPFSPDQYLGLIVNTTEHQSLFFGVGSTEELCHMLAEITKILAVNLSNTIGEKKTASLIHVSVMCGLTDALPNYPECFFPHESEDDEE